MKSQPLLTGIKTEPENPPGLTLEAQRAAVIKWKKDELFQRKQEKSKLEKELRYKPRSLRRSIRRPKSFYNSDFISFDILSDYRIEEIQEILQKSCENDVNGNESNENNSSNNSNNIDDNDTLKTKIKEKVKKEKTIGDETNKTSKRKRKSITEKEEAQTKTRRKSVAEKKNAQSNSPKLTETDVDIDLPVQGLDYKCGSPKIPVVSDFSSSEQSDSDSEIKSHRKRKARKDKEKSNQEQKNNISQQKRSKKKVPKNFFQDNNFDDEANDYVTSKLSFGSENDTEKIDSDAALLSPPPLKVKKKYHNPKRKSTLASSPTSNTNDNISQSEPQEPDFSPLRDIWGDPTFFITDKKSTDLSARYSAFSDVDRNALRRVDELRDQRKWPGFSLTAPPRLLTALPSTPQPTCPKTHWDYLLAEMEWLAKDFQEERKRKKGAAKRAIKLCAKKVKDRGTRAERKQKEREAGLKRIAAFTARIVRRFWSDVDKISQYKLKVKLDAEKSQAMTKHLDFMVGQTERLSQQIAMDLSHSGNNKGSNISDNANAGNIAPIDIANGSGIKKEEECGGNENYKEDLSAAGAITSREKIEKAAEEAMAAQPTGSTLATTHVRTPVPFLIRGTLREYQHVGLDWLATMYEKRLNVILADDMGLGKTIMTISLLAHLAGERGVWGPHLIIVPSSTVMNWELELRKWCPALKVVTYIGNPKERRARRTGWAKENALHVCITSYRIALQDAQLLKRKKWCYMILDEAQNIKNFRSQRWQVLLQYHSERRLLLTGTPLQNSVMELWSLMHFLMPAVFASHAEFAEWFAVPLNSLVESGTTGSAAEDSGLVARLHAVLRPFLLRRVKRVVEHDLPPKREVLVPCTLSRRQQLLYEEFIGAASTQETLASGSFFGVVNVLMQLRKVCNHPDLFAPRPTESPFVLPPPSPLRIPAELATIASSSLKMCTRGTAVPSWASLELESRYSLPFASRDSAVLSLLKAKDFSLLAAERKKDLLDNENDDIDGCLSFVDRFARDRRRAELEDDILCLTHYANVSRDRAVWSSSPLFGGAGLREILTVRRPCDSIGSPLVKSLEQRVDEWSALGPHYLFLHQKVMAPPRELWLSKGWAPLVCEKERCEEMVADAVKPILDLFEPIDIRLKMHFPDKRLLQYDCGKLQVLHPLLTNLRDDGHKVVLFTRE